MSCQVDYSQGIFSGGGGGGGGAIRPPENGFALPPEVGLNQ